MRSGLAVLFATVWIAAAQHAGGGMQTGPSPGGSPSGTWSHQPGPPNGGTGKGPNWGWRGRRFFRRTNLIWPVFPWFGSPGCLPYGFTAIDYFLPGTCGSGYYPPQPAASNPPVNVIFAPPEAPPPPFLAVNPEFAAAEPSTPQPQQSAATSTSAKQNDTPASNHGAPDSTRASFARPAAPSRYPPVIALKTGGMYSIKKFWYKNKKLYFVTTQGDTLYAPASQLDHVYPGGVE